MEQDIFLDMFFAFFFAVSENLFTFAAIKGSHWRNLPKVLSRVAVFRDAATFVRKGDFRITRGLTLCEAQTLSHGHLGMGASSPKMRIEKRKSLRLPFLCFCHLNRSLS